MKLLKIFQNKNIFIKNKLKKRKSKMELVQEKYNFLKI